MLGMEKGRLKMTKDKKIIPAHYMTNLHVISVSFATENQDDPIIWRGPMKTNLIMQFTKDVEWGDLDYLVIDSPPGTGDEIITIMQNLKDNLQAVIVSTPNDLSMADAKKALNMCYKFNVPIAGFIENMAGDIFGSGAVEEYAKKMNTSFLGRIEMSKEMAKVSSKKQVLKIEKTFDNIVKQIKRNDT
jgi:Mrp family chromosome partitioning ATPase